jgi:transposase
MNQSTAEIARPSWAGDAVRMRASGYRIVHIAERVGVPPASVKAVLDAKKPRETIYAPAPWPPLPSAITYMMTVDAICARHGVTLDDIRAYCRKPKMVEIRREVWAYLVHERGWSVTKAGRFLNRDHACVLASLGRGKVRRKAAPPVSEGKL